MTIVGKHQPSLGKLHPDRRRSEIGHQCPALRGSAHTGFVKFWRQQLQAVKRCQQQGIHAVTTLLAADRLAPGLGLLDQHPGVSHGPHAIGNGRTSKARCTRRFFVASALVDAQVLGMILCRIGQRAIPAQGCNAQLGADFIEPVKVASDRQVHAGPGLGSSRRGTERAWCPKTCTTTTATTRRKAQGQRQHTGPQHRLVHLDISIAFQMP